ncbi:UNVERIFIED_CONTAM: hypothetical protein GTU68_014276, partial [Idotea baltica]|nr:hypothetical protein [Idotea baltica]
YSNLSNYYFQATSDEISNGGILEEILIGPLNASDTRVINILQRKYLDPPSSKPYNLSTDFKYKTRKNSYSWPFIHIFIQRLFSNQSGGFFVEAGALDGEFMSNTLWLEQESNWTGLLVEPDLYNYRELLMKQRRAWASNSCLSSNSYPKQTIMVSRRRNNEQTSRKYPPWIFRGASHQLEYSLPSSYDSFFALSTSTYLNVQSFPLYSYLLALNVTTVDLIILDVQGAEIGIIESIPFDKTRIRVFIIEHITDNRLDKDFVQFFDKKGYQLIGYGGESDYVFVLKSEFSSRKFETVTKFQTE